MTEPTVIQNSADAMAALLGAQVDPTTGQLTTLPGTTPPVPATTPAVVPATTPSAAEIVSMTGEEAIAKLNELLAAQATAAEEKAALEADRDKWQKQSRTNERAKKALAKALKDSGNAGDPADPATDVHTDDQDDDDDDSPDVSTLRQENMRLRAALAAGLDESDASRLVGSTPEALKADALALKKRFAASAMRPPGSADGGAGVTLRVATPQQDLASTIAKALAR